MKKCLKCGTKFDDRFQFCPECGGQLSPVNECPNCHLELAPNARFCPACGTPVAAQPQPAPQPAPQNRPAPQAAPAPQPAPQPQPQPQPQPAPQPYPQQAPQQQYQQPAPQPQPAPQQYPQQGYQQQGYYGYQQPQQPRQPRQRNPYVMQTVNRFVFMGMFILSALLYLTAMIFGIVDTIGSFTYFGGGVGVIIVLVFSYLLLTLALIGFIVSLATGIASIVRSFRDKEHHVNAKPLMFMTMFAVPFMAYYNFCFGGAYMGILLYSFCNIFLITTISLTTLALATHKVLSGEMKVKPILANAFAGLAFMFVAMIVIFGIMPSGSWLLGIPYINLFCLIASIFGLAALILLLIALPKSLKRERGIKGSVILLSISAGLNVFAFVFMIIAGGLAVALVPFILMWVFFVFALALLIVSSKLDPKKPARPRPEPRQYQPYPQQGYQQPQQGYPQYQQQPQGYPQYQQQPQPQPQQPQPQDPNNPYRY